MLSTRDLSRLPDVDKLKALTQSLAMLDAILSPDWEYRYWSFNMRWRDDLAVASMRDGSGDELFAMFGPVGSIIKGFAHESPMSPYAANPPTVWPSVLDSVPTVFADFLSEPAFSPFEMTFCVWRTHSDTVWQHGSIEFPEEEDPDGSASLLALLDGNPQTYQTWAEYYYGRSVSLSAITHVYEHHPLTKALIAELNAKASVRKLERERKQIGYP